MLHVWLGHASFIQRNQSVFRNYDQSDSNISAMANGMTSKVCSRRPNGFNRVIPMCTLLKQCLMKINENAFADRLKPNNQIKHKEIVPMDNLKGWRSMIDWQTERWPVKMGALKMQDLKMTVLIARLENAVQLKYCETVMRCLKVLSETTIYLIIYYGNAETDLCILLLLMHIHRKKRNSI